MAQNSVILRTSFRYSLLLTLFSCVAVAVNGQAGGGVDSTGTGGQHAISGRLVFPSGQRADARLKVKLESSGNGELFVLADGNGTFTFRGLREGSYNVVVEVGNFFETASETIYRETTITDLRTDITIGPH